MIRFSHHSKSSEELVNNFTICFWMPSLKSVSLWYTHFLACSAVEFHWREIILIVAHQYGEKLTDEDVNTVDWIPKSII